MVVAVASPTVAAGVVLVAAVVVSVAVDLEVAAAVAVAVASAEVVASPLVAVPRGAGEEDAVNFLRCIRHAFAGDPAGTRFPPAALQAIQQAVASGEHRHRGEICFAIEGALHWRSALRGMTARQRAHEVFAQLRVWDTRENTGVLVYVLLVEHAIEIVADRGVSARIDDGQWNAICSALRDRFAKGEFHQGAIAASDAISDLLAAHFPVDGGVRVDELPDRPVLL